MAMETSTPRIEKNPTLTRSLSQISSSSKFYDENHGSSLLTGLHRAFMAQHHCDVTLVVGTDKIQAHRVILQAFSPYFEAMFDFNMRDDKMLQEEIVMPDMSAKIVRQILEFGYSGEIEITGENVQDLLLTANFLNIQNIQEACCEFMYKHIDASNCLTILSFSGLVGCSDLMKKTYNYCAHHFGQIRKDQAFLECPSHIIIELIRDESLFIIEDDMIPSPSKYEETICDAVFTYIEYDVFERKHLLPDMLRAVRLPLVSQEFLYRIEVKVTELGVLQECGEIIEQAKQLQLSEGVFSDDAPTWAQPRASAFIKQMWGPCYAHGYVHPEIEVFDHVFPDKRVYVTGMKLYIRRWDGRPCLGGMHVWYSNGMEYAHGGVTSEAHEFHIENNEKIIKVIVQSGWMIDNLTFFTKHHTFGPYGGPGGSTRPNDCAPQGHYGFLSGLKGAVVQSQGSKGITSLSFNWSFYPQINHNE